MAAPFDSRQRGQTLVEFALLLPVLILLVLAIFEFGRAFYAYSTVANAAREAARFGTVDPTNTQGIRDAAKNKSVALGLQDGDILVSCPDDNGSCTDNGSGNNLITHRIQVTINYTFTAVVPLIPSFPLHGYATMRIEAQ